MTSAVRRFCALVPLVAVALGCSGLGPPFGEAPPSPLGNPAASESIAPMPSASPSAATSGAPGQRNLETRPLGQPRGGWAFALKHVAGYSQVSEEVWAVPVDGSAAAKLLVRYEKPWGGVPSDIPPDMVLRHLFAPDGKRIVVSGPDDELVVVDLTSGATRSLGVRGIRPGWSKDGRWIAYTRHEVMTPCEPAPSCTTPVLWLIPSEGGDAKKLPGTFADEWSPDGARLVSLEREAAVVIDVVSGAIVARLSTPGDAQGTYAFWRSGSPALALEVLEFPSNGWPGTRIDVMNPPFVSARTVTPREEPYLEAYHAVPRWNPVRDELLFLRFTAHPAGGVPADGEPIVVTYSLSSGSERTIPISVQHATWHPDGERIVYVPPVLRGAAFKTPLPGLSPALVVARRDGTTERTLMTADRQSDQFLGIATLSY